MDSPRFEINPLPLEKEFHVHYLKEHLGELSREELESLLKQYIDTVVKLTHVTKQLMGHIEGKS